MKEKEVFVEFVPQGDCMLVTWRDDKRSGALYLSRDGETKEFVLSNVITTKDLREVFDEFLLIVKATIRLSENQSLVADINREEFEKFLREAYCSDKGKSIKIIYTDNSVPLFSKDSDCA